MTFAKPQFLKKEINRAGTVLASASATPEERAWALGVLSNWRASHGYPMNTFQATLRARLKHVDADAIVAQRLKRAPSVILKLQRFPTMNLAQMQDIAGLRAVVGSIRRVRALEAVYRNSPLQHELVSSKDYIETPKVDGYRSVHLVYRYHNDRAPEYDQLLVELQFRSKRQHAWATAVETMGTFVGQALKAGQGAKKWLRFFEAASASLTHIERTNPMPAYAQLSPSEVFELVAELEAKLHVLDKLQSFAIAAAQITAGKGSGSYHLIVLDSARRTVHIRPFATARLEEASAEYAKIEERTQQGELVEAVLVSAGPVEALRKAYPNYFLDTRAFIREMQLVIARTKARRRVVRSVIESRRSN